MQVHIVWENVRAAFNNINVKIEPWHEDPSGLSDVLVQRTPLTVTPKNSEQVFCDAYALRDAFEAVETVEEVRIFLTRCGPFAYRDKPEEALRALKFKTGETAIDLEIQRRSIEVTFGEFQEWQKFFSQWKVDAHHCRLKPPDVYSLTENRSVRGDCTWLVSPSDRFRSSERQAGIMGRIICRSAVEVIAATIQLDLLRGIRWRRCAECNRIFEAGDPRKQFCDHECAHAHGQRRRRAAVKSARGR